MDIAVISPIKHLRHFSSQGDFDFCLAHIALESKEYVKYFRDQSRTGRYVLVDNGVFEKDKAVEIEQLLDVARMVGASEVVAPDVLRDSAGTIESVEKFLKVVKKGKHLGKFKIQAVAQGASLSWWFSCYQKLSEIKEIDVLGIPFDMTFQKLDVSPTRNMWLNRLAAINYLWLSGQASVKPHHLLGLSDPVELRSQRYFPFVRSNDSSSAVVHGARGVQFSEFGLLREKEQTKLDFFGSVSKADFGNVRHNIMMIRRFAGSLV